MTEKSPREKLLEGAIDYVAHNGITDLSLRQLAAALGTSHRMLIHHFGSREGLLVEVIKVVEERQRAIMSEVMAAEPGEEPWAREMRFWQHLRSPELAPQERLFFEVYGQALQGRSWARPLLDGIVDDWIDPLVAMPQAQGVPPETARALARLNIAVGRGLLLDVLATGDTEGVDAALRLFLQLMTAAI